VTKGQAENLLNLAVHLARMRPGIPAHQIAADVREFSRLAGICRRVAVARCNGTGEARRNKRTLERVCMRLGKAGGLLGSYAPMSAQVEGDPRGYVFHLKHPKLPGNTLGGQERGYGIK